MQVQGYRIITLSLGQKYPGSEIGLGYIFIVQGA